MLLSPLVLLVELVSVSLLLLVLFVVLVLSFDVPWLAVFWLLFEVDCVALLLLPELSEFSLVVLLLVVLDLPFVWVF